MLEDKDRFNVSVKLSTGPHTLAVGRWGRQAEDTLHRANLLGVIFKTACMIADVLIVEREPHPTSSRQESLAPSMRIQPHTLQHHASKTKLPRAQELVLNTIAACELMSARFETLYRTRQPLNRPCRLKVSGSPKRLPDLEIYSENAQPLLFSY